MIDAQKKLFPPKKKAELTPSSGKRGTLRARSSLCLDGGEGGKPVSFSEPSDLERKGIHLSGGAKRKTSDPVEDKYREKGGSSKVRHLRKKLLHAFTNKSKLRDGTQKTKKGKKVTPHRRKDDPQKEKNGG